MSIATNWDNFCNKLYVFDSIKTWIDLSRVGLADDITSDMPSNMPGALADILALEAGAIANPDENQMVGHYWLRNPDLAPDSKITGEINRTNQRISGFVQEVHRQGYFKYLLIIGIGGSNLGVDFIYKALRDNPQKMQLFFIDNTDPDGMDRVFKELEPNLAQTLTIVISKSGSTIETKNAMEEARSFYHKHGLDFARHAIAITQSQSSLDNLAMEEGWLNTFPMWSFVGGRTSIFSPIGLLPLALMGIDIFTMLKGGALTDMLTRERDPIQNPAALLALAWYKLTEGKGGREMVVLPYKDRLDTFPTYLQQLIMESIGKENSLTGEVVQQGLTVLGSKGSTAQHSYFQQLLEGPDSFFATFIEVLKDRQGKSALVEGNSTAGDYLNGFLAASKAAMSLKNRSSITITIETVDEFSLGSLIALYERAVSIYASLVGVNPYNQPAVEIGKHAADKIIDLKNALVKFLSQHQGELFTTAELSDRLQAPEKEVIFKTLWHIAYNQDYNIIMKPEAKVTDSKFGYVID